MRKWIPMALIALATVGLAPDSVAACEECISQKLNDIWEHWQGEIPGENTLYDVDHSSPEGGKCGDYHDECNPHEEDVQEVLAASLDGTLTEDQVRRLHTVLGDRFVPDGEEGVVYAMNCSWSRATAIRLPASVANVLSKL